QRDTDGALRKEIDPAKPVVDVQVAHSDRQRSRGLVNYWAPEYQEYGPTGHGLVNDQITPGQRRLSESRRELRPHLGVRRSGWITFQMPHGVVFQSFPRCRVP